MAIGKSTLINAIVADDDVILPAGGIGPLTAQAIQVGYSDEPRFRVEYHGPGPFNRLLFALDRWLETSKGAAAAPAPGDGEVQEDVEDIGQQRKNLEGQARLMVTGDHCARKPLDTADIVREAISQQLPIEVGLRHLPGRGEVGSIFGKNGTIQQTIDLP